MQHVTLNNGLQMVFWALSGSSSVRIHRHKAETRTPPVLNGWNYEAHLSLTTTLPFARPAST
jgi:hypothetical protein